MKIALIADVHGNDVALQAVFTDIDTQGNIDHIYIVGDLIAIGPQTNEVLKRIFARTDVSIMSGNHDEAVIALINEEAYPMSHKTVRSHHEWVISTLDESLIDLLKDIPRAIRKDIAGHAFHFSHYALLEGLENAPIAMDPFKRIVEPSLESMEKLFSKIDDEIICFGHHHPVHLFQNSNRIFINPGALGCSVKSIANYGLITISE